MGFDTDAPAVPADPAPKPPTRAHEKIPDLVEHFRLSAKRQGDDTIVTVRNRNKRNAYKTEQWTRVRDLGQGSFGIVRLERKIENGLEELRAVKEIVTAAKSYKHFSAACAQELYALARLSREEFYGWFEDARRVYLVMEYFPLGDLGEHLEVAILERDAREIVKQLLAGLEVVHGHGITHRDLKPQNIFVVEKSPEWWVKIGDFGICKRIEEDDTNLYTTVGSRLFMAPEMVDEDREDAYTNAVDIWALGCVLFLMLTGTHLFASREDMPKIDSCWVCPESSWNGSNCSPQCIDFTNDLLTIDATRRPTAESAKDLPWINETPILKAPPPGIEPTGSSSNKISSRPIESDNPDIGYRLRRDQSRPDIGLHREERYISPTESVLTKQPRNSTHATQSHNCGEVVEQPTSSKNFLYFRYTRCGRSWDEEPVINEIPASQAEIRRKVENQHSNDPVIVCLARMGLNRRNQISRHVGYLNAKEADGSLWEPVLFSNSSVRYEGRIMEVKVFEVIFARTQSQKWETRIGPEESFGNTELIDFTTSSRASRSQVQNPRVMDEVKGGTIEEKNNIVAAVQQILEEEVPDGERERHEYASEQLQKAGILAALRSDTIGAALHYYRGLRAYHEPRSLAMTYRYTLSDDVLRILSIAVEADQDLDVEPEDLIDNAAQF